MAAAYSPPTPPIRPGMSADTLAQVTRALAKDGVAVVPGVMSAEECDQHVTEINVWLEKFNEYGGFPDNFSSVIHKYRAAHHPAAWAARLRAAPVFEALWGTEKITSSIDGMAIGEPPETGRSNFADTQPLKLHLDQGGKKAGLHAYQGALYMEDADEDDWVLAVMNGSHKHHAEFFANRTKKPSRSEFLALTQAEVKWYKQRGCYVRRMAVPKGGMVLWDSRTVHAGAPPTMHRKNPDRWRYVAFVCMAPAVWASTEELASKKNAYHKMICSRHWPAQGFDTFAPRHVFDMLNTVQELPDIAKSEKARLLAGDLDYDFSDGKSVGPPRPLMLP